jgi:hypothetical protein
MATVMLVSFSFGQLNAMRRCRRRTSSGFCESSETGARPLWPIG